MRFRFCFWRAGVPVLLAVLVAWLPVSAFAQSGQAAARTGETSVILIHGDSISAAYGLEIRQGWVSLLQARLDRELPGRWRVVNGSVSGETSSGGLSRLPALLARHAPAVVVIELGGNDGLRGQPPALLRRNLVAMAGLADKAGARVLLLGMKLPPSYGGAYTRAFEKAFSDAAGETGAPLLPFLLEGVGGDERYMQRDGIHPTAAAQARLLDNAWPLIRKAVTEAGRKR